MTAYVNRWFQSHDGLRLYARDHAGAEGEARLPVIAIHGLTRNSADFGHIAGRMAASGRRVIAVDVRGRGLSERAADPMTYVPATYADDVIALCEQLGVARAVFLGTSMGGLITMTLAGIKPYLIAAAIMNDVGPEVSMVGLTRIAAYAGKPVDTQSWDDARTYVKTHNAVALPHYADADWDAFARRVFREDDQGRPRLDYDPDISVPIRAAGQAALVPDLWGDFETLTAGRPTMLIRGGVSDLLNAEIAGRMRQRAPAMQYVEVPAVGHAPMLDEPAAEDAILAFLKTLP